MNVVKTEWHEVVAKALEQGHAKGLPRPEGLREDGHFNLSKTTWQDGRVKRTLYYGVKGDMTTIGWWVEAAQGREMPAPGVNGTGPKKGGRPAPPPAAPERAAQEPVASEDVEPLILLTPAGGGAWRLNGYGVARAELIRALRLSLVHLVARQAGALIIDEVVAPEMAVVAEGLLRRQPTPPALRGATQPARNDKAPGKRPAAGVTGEADEEISADLGRV